MKKYFTITVYTTKGGSMIVAGYFNNANEAGAYGQKMILMAGYEWNDIKCISVRENENW